MFKAIPMHTKPLNHAFAFIFQDFGFRQTLFELACQGFGIEFFNCFHKTPKTVKNQQRTKPTNGFIKT